MDDTTQNEEVVEEEAPAAPTQDTPNSNVTVLLSLEEMIKNNIAALDKLAVEIKEKRHMFTDAFQNDATYKENEEKAKEANVTKLQTKQQILKQPQMMQLSENIKSMNADMKERRNALSDYLLEYQRMTGAVTIEDLDGNIREIINDAKAVKRTSKK